MHIWPGKFYRCVPYKYSNNCISEWGWGAYRYCAVLLKQSYALRPHGYTCRTTTLNEQRLSVALEPVADPGILEPGVRSRRGLMPLSTYLMLFLVTVENEIHTVNIKYCLQ